MIFKQLLHSVVAMVIAKHIRTTSIAWRTTLPSQRLCDVCQDISVLQTKISLVISLVKLLKIAFSLQCWV